MVEVNSIQFITRRVSNVRHHDNLETSNTLVRGAFSCPIIEFQFIKLMEIRRLINIMVISGTLSVKANLTIPAIHIIYNMAD